MSAITDDLIKFIVGALIVIVVLIGVFFLFKNSILDFFKNLIGGNQALKINLFLLKKF